LVGGSAPASPRVETRRRQSWQRYYRPMGTRKDVGRPIFPGKFVVPAFSWRQMKNRTDRKLESKVSGQGERFEEEEAMVHVNSLQLARAEILC